MSNKQIAHMFGVRENAIKQRLRRYQEKLDLSNRVQLAVWYVLKYEIGGNDETIVADIPVVLRGGSIRPA